jgi:hypothetical protein
LDGGRPIRNDPAQEIKGRGKPVRDTMSMEEFARICDDPARDLRAGSGVRAIVVVEPEEGFALSAVRGRRVYAIVDGEGRRRRFRTMALALAELQDVAGLSFDIGVQSAAAEAY